MPGLRGGALIFITTLFFYNLSFAGEVIEFPKRKNSKTFCRKYLASSESAKPTTRRSADIAQIDSYRSEYISPKDFFHLYPFGDAIFKPNQAPVMIFTPKYVTDYNPVFSSSNFARWKPLGARTTFSSKQESYILLGFVARENQLHFLPHSFNKGVNTEYQRIMTEFAPAHHTTFVVPKLYRLILSTVEHISSTSSYLLHNGREESIDINFSLVFSRQDNIKYGARDFISSWRTRNSMERQVQEFLIRFIDLKVRNNEEVVYEKEFLNATLTELRESFKGSPEMSNSLTNLETELMSILRLSNLETY